jgi:hypothetical protein
VPAVHFGTYDVPEAAQSLERLKPMDGPDGVCGSDALGRPMYFLYYPTAGYNFSDGTVTAELADPANATLSYARGAATMYKDRQLVPAEVCGSGCTNAWDARQCPTLPCATQLYGYKSEEHGGRKCASYPASTEVGCYCKARLTKAIALHGLSAGGEMVMAEDPMCMPFVRDFIMGSTIMVLAAIVVAVINVSLKTTLKGLVGFERRDSVSEAAMSTSTKVGW